MVKQFFKEFYQIIDKTGFHVSLVYPRPFERFGIKSKDYLIGAEIGVYKGEHSLSMLKKLNIHKLYLIDPYELYNDYDGSDMNNKVIEIKEKSKQKLKKYNNKIEWIYKRSSDCLKQIPEGLDFVYIDGNHSYKYVKEDIINYYKKVKSGGTIGGHDIALPDVAQAVSEFVVKNKLKLHVRGCDWWVIKK